MPIRQRIIAILTGILVTLLTTACTHHTSAEDEELRYIDSLITAKYGIKRPSSATHLLFINENNGVCNDCAMECLKFVRDHSQSEELYYFVTIRKSDSLFPSDLIDELGSNGVIRHGEDRLLLTDPTSGLTYIGIKENRVDTIIRISYPSHDSLCAVEEIMKSGVRPSV